MWIDSIALAFAFSDNLMSASTTGATSRLRLPLDDCGWRSIDSFSVSDGPKGRVATRAGRTSDLAEQDPDVTVLAGFSFRSFSFRKHSFGPLVRGTTCEPVLTVLQWAS